ncbi:hypothetical protein V8D89_008687 [Ganoderma adspersum]
MAPVASSSSASGSRSRPRKDLFKPKFPLDPFSGHSAAALGEPWFLKINALLNATAFHRRNVIFVIGAPSLIEIGPLIQSHQLAKSLVILATHNPPDIPGIVYPTVRILRLNVPLALEDSGAVRFVNVLEWAERVARTWRKHGGAGVVELSEESDINGNGDLKPPSVFRFGSQSTPPSPRSSTTHLGGESCAPPSRPASRSTSRPSSIASILFLNKGSGSLPPPDPSQRPFDVLINFVPEKISDKALLKNTILVTTISRPFLKASYGGAASSVRTRATSSSSPPSSPRLARPRSIFGAFSRSSSSLSVYIPSTPQNLSRDSLPLSPASASLYAPPGKALLVHLLPSPHPKEPPGARRRLVDSMETFLLSFSFRSAPGMQTQTPTSPARTSTYSPGTAARPASGMWQHVDTDHARAYLMQTSTFCDTVGVASELTHGPSGSVESGETGEWTVADIVLSGALDADVSANVDPLTNSPVTPAPTVAGVGRPRKPTRRAWIAAATDLVIVPSAAGDDCSPSPSLSHAHAHAHALGQATPSKTARSSSAPLLSAEWAPSSFGGRPPSMSMSHPPPQARTETLVPPVALSSSSTSSSDSSSSSSSNQGSMPPPPMCASASVSSTPPSSLGPRTPPSSSSGSESEHGGAPGTDTGKAAPRMGVGLAVAMSVDGRGDAKGAKVAKWKFWRRKAGAHTNATASAAEVGIGA